MNEFFLIMPEVFVVLTLAFVVFGEITYSGEERRLIGATAQIGLAGAFLQTILTYQYGASQIFSHTFSVDGLSLFFKLLFILLASLSMVTVSHTREIHPERRTEFIALILASTLAMFLAASAADLLLVFLSLQCMNILAYFIAGYGKNSIHSIEAAVKYMIFSAVSAALLLYGMALLFSVTHTLNIFEMHRFLLATPMPRETMLVVFILIFLSLSFQFAAFPMHFWAPDVFEGTPTPASSFLSLGTRAGGLVVALRILIGVFAQADLAPGKWQVLGAVDWPKMIGFVSAVTMVVGALLAFRQQAAKRMVGALLVAETGYLLLGLLVLDQVGIAAVLYSLVIELFSLVGIFYVLSYLYDEVKSDRFSDLKGMMGRAVPECICLVLFMMTLVGVPPSPGFIGKFTLVGAAVRHNWLFLGVVAIFAMSVSTVAVFRFAYGLSGDLRFTLNAPVAASRERRIFLAVLLIPMIMAGVGAELLLEWAGKSLNFIFW